MAPPTDRELLAALVAELSPSTRAALALRLRALCHDFNGPLGTIGLELFTVTEELTGPDAGGAEALSEVLAALRNVEGAKDRCVELVARLQVLAREL